MAESEWTYIEDGDTVMRSLAAMAARAEVLQDRVKGIVADISAAESGRPWGTAEEFGGQFEKQYHAGDNGGAAFVRNKAHTVATTTAEGAATAFQAMQGSLEVDQQGAQLFSRGITDDLANSMRTIATQRGGDTSGDAGPPPG